MAARKYGLLFALFALLLAGAAVINGGFGWLLLWPASNFLVVAVGYLGVGPAVFAKGADGRLNLFVLAFLAPFLLYTWGIWHLMRLFTREPPMNELIDGIWIGRRLLARELSDSVVRVLDLTAEFPEPARQRGLPSYYSSPIMDAGVPTPSQFSRILAFLTSDVGGDTYIHCAQGHGRTSMVAVAYLIATGECATIEKAIERVQVCRPLATMNARQRTFLQSQVFLISSAEVSIES